MSTSWNAVAHNQIPRWNSWIYSIQHQGSAVFELSHILTHQSILYYREAEYDLKRHCLLHSNFLNSFFLKNRRKQIVFQGHLLIFKMHVCMFPQAFWGKWDWKSPWSVWLLPVHRCLSPSGMTLGWTLASLSSIPLFEKTICSDLIPAYVPVQEDLKVLHVTAQSLLLLRPKLRSMEGSGCPR